MTTAIIVEGKNDKSKLQKLLSSEIEIHCTFGTPGTKQLQQLADKLKHHDIFIFTDNDSSGRRIRAMLRELFPDAEHMYTRRGYNGVERTPIDYLIQQIEKAGLEQYLVDTAAHPASFWEKKDF